MRRKNGFMTAEKMAEARRMREARATLGEISEKLGVSVGWLCVRLRGAGARKPKKEKPAPGCYRVTRPTDTHAEILRLRLAGETLEAIGDKFGMTRERVRQICESLEPGIGGRLKRENRAWREEAKAVIVFPIPNFKLRARAWLRDAGYLVCSLCKFVEEIDGRKRIQQCRECNRKRAWARGNGKPVEEYAPKQGYGWLKELHKKPAIDEAVAVGLVWCSGHQKGLAPEMFYLGDHGKRGAVCRECQNANTKRSYRKKMAKLKDAKRVGARKGEAR